MHVINRSGKNITVMVGKNPAPFTIFNPNWNWIHEGQKKAYSMGTDDIRMMVVHGFQHKPFNGCSIFEFNIRDGVGYIVRNSNKRYHIYDYTTLTSYWNNHVESVKKEQSDDYSVQATEVANILINSLTAALSALGPMGSLPAGLTLGIGSLLLLGAGATGSKPPEPPTLEDITEAVREVVKEELTKYDAKSAAVVFRNAASWYQEQIALAYSQLRGNDGTGNQAEELSQHDLEDFINGLESYLNPASSPLLQRIGEIEAYPERGQYILSALITGLMTYLHLERIHLWIRHLNGARITDGSLNVLKDRVVRAQKILSAATESLMKTVEAPIVSAGLSQTPEGSEIAKLQYQAFTGYDDLSFITTFTDKLAEFEASLNEDVEDIKKGIEPSRTWKPGIDKENKRANPNKR